MADKIDPNKLKTRDWVLVGVIKGATKAGVHKDQKKEANRTASRGKKMSRADRGQEQAQQNTMQLAELKALKETLAKQKKTIEALTAEVDALKARSSVVKQGDFIQVKTVSVFPEVETVKPRLLTTEQIDEIAATDDLVAAIVDARSGK